MKKTARSQIKIKLNKPITLPLTHKELLPPISARETTIITRAVSLSTKLPHKSLLNSPGIEKSAKNLLLMKKIKVLNQSQSSNQDQQDRHILKRLQSGKKQKILPQLLILTKNTNRQNILKQPYIQQSLIGQQAVQKFYQRYKQLDKRKDRQDFFNQKHALTNIVNLLQIHNFTPRKLTIVKLKGEEAILDLKKLGLGQGSMGPAVIQIINYLPQFQTIDLSHNRIDAILGESIIEKLGKTKNINLAHNRIGKNGCQKFSELFLTQTTKIQDLILQDNNLVDNAGATLIQHLARYNNLRLLNLNKNYMGDKFAQKLRIFLKEDRRLQQLYLSWNQFSSKGVKAILQGVSEHADLKVFDFSWNKIEFQNVSMLSKIFSQVASLIHADFAFCQISLKSIAALTEALRQNHTLYGLHFQGNSGFIDNKGFLVPTQKQFNEYPLPIIKGIIRKIDGIKPNPTNQYKIGSMRDVCWICHSWQQKSFAIPYSQEMKQQTKELNPANVNCYIHFKHENYKAAKMYLSEDGSKYQILRMCPLGSIQFFFTFSPGSGRRYTTSSTLYQTKQTSFELYYFIGKIDVHDTIKELNCMTVVYSEPPLDDGYDPNIDLQPRTAEVGINYNKGQRVKIKLKRKVVRQQKVKVNLKNLDEEQDDDFLRDKENRDNDNEYLKRCLEFDLQNSKIYKLIKDEADLNRFKIMMQKYYKSFKDTFYYLAKDNPTVNGIYAISELKFTGFLDEQKYVTKRVTQAKVMLKLYACLSVGDQTSNKPQQKSNNKLLSRPQFLQFLIRLAIQKWCSFNPSKKKKPFVDQQKLWQQEQKKILLMKRNNSKLIKSQKSQKLDMLESKSKKIEQKIQEQKSIKQVQKVDQQSSSQDQKQQQTKKLKLKLPLPLVDGIQKTISSLVRYGQNYRSSNWRKNSYLKVDNLIVLKAYDQFLNSLFQKYTQVKFKTNKPKRLTNLLTLDQLKNMFLDTGIRKTKEAMKQMEEAFLDSKRLQNQDGNLQYGLSYQQFQQCVARISQSVWFNPPAAANAPMWNNQLNRKYTPLFLKFQSLIIALYWKTPELHNRRMTKIVDKGIFQVQIELIMQKIEQLSLKGGNVGLNRLNSIQGDNEINLKDIIDQLREKFDKMVILHQEEEEYEQQVQRN